LRGDGADGEESECGKGAGRFPEDKHWECVPF
jgi:hypothetical protein